MIIYLHGLNSSAASEKARLTAEYCGENGIDCIAPTLHHRPAKAVEQIGALVADGGAHTLVGSSMGGYYATWFCEQHPHLRGVLINPAIHLADLLGDFVGKRQENYNTGEEYIFEEAHLSEFAALDVTKITRPERYLLLVQTGDELLDYRNAVQFYLGGQHVVEEGGNHMFSNYARHLPAIVAFAGAPGSGSDASGAAA